MSECDVCIGGNDSYDPAEFVNERSPKARRQHKCCECGRAIVVGETYWRVVGKWEGCLQTFRQCLPCHEIQIVFACGQGYLYTQLWEDMENVMEALKVTSPCFNQLSVPARAFLTERWWQWKERTAER